MPKKAKTINNFFIIILYGLISHLKCRLGVVFIKRNSLINGKKSKNKLDLDSVYLSQFKQSKFLKNHEKWAVMSNKVINLKNKSILYFALGSTLAFILYLSLILNPASACFRLDSGSNSLGLSFSYTLEVVLDFFTARNQEQLLCYSQFLKVWDIVFAVIYTLMYGSWILYLLNKKIFLIVPILGMIADWSENFSELLMIESYVTSGSISQSLISIGSGINSFKWIMSSLTYLIVIIGIIVVIKTFMARNKSN